MADTILLTLTESKAFLDIQDTAQDAALQQLTNAVARVVEQRVGPIDPATYTRTVRGSGESAQAFPHTNVTAVTDCLYVDGSDVGLDLSAGNLILDPGGMVYLKSGTWPCVRLVLTYTVGMTPTANMKEAAKIILQQAWAAYRGTGRPGKGAPADPTSPAVLIPWRAEALLAADSLSIGFA